MCPLRDFQHFVSECLLYQNVRRFTKLICPLLGMLEMFTVDAFSFVFKLHCLADPYKILLLYELVQSQFIQYATDSKLSL